MNLSSLVPSIFISILLIAVLTTASVADPCLVVYPGGPCVYHYSPDEYYTAGPGHPYYAAEYDRGGLVLLELGSNEIDYSIYQAPGLTGFEESTDGEDGYVFIGTDFELIVDGFYNSPTTFYDVIIVFDRFDPEYCTPVISIDGDEIPGTNYNIGDLDVSTPTAEGNNYSDTATFQVSWRGCYGVHIWAFSDENGNGEMDGGECFTAFSHDMVVPAAETSWGAIKSIQR